MLNNTLYSSSYDQLYVSIVWSIVNSGFSIDCDTWQYCSALISMDYEHGIKARVHNIMNS